VVRVQGGAHLHAFAEVVHFPQPHERPRDGAVVCRHRGVPQPARPRLRLLKVPAAEAALLLA
jgi:hypothetical protein